MTNFNSENICLEIDCLLDNSSFNKLFSILPNDFTQVKDEIFIPNYKLKQENFFQETGIFQSIIIKLSTLFNNRNLNFEQVININIKTSNLYLC